MLKDLSWRSKNQMSQLFIEIEFDWFLPNAPYNYLLAYYLLYSYWRSLTFFLFIEGAANKQFQEFLTINNERQ